MSDPDSPIEVGTVPGTSGVMSLELRGSFLYVAMYSSGTRVFDVSNPPEPRLIFSTPETGESWHVSGRYPIACVADLQEGVEVLDLSRPAGESLLIRESTLAPHTLYYTNNYVHVADQDEGYVLLQLDHHPAPRQPTGRLVPVGATTGAS